MIRSTNSADAARAALALPTKSVILLIGPTDTGKTTFAHNLIRSALGESSPPIGYVDGDVGQTETGPPGVVNGIVITAKEAEEPPRTWPRIGGAFVGATSPVPRPMEWVAAIAVAGRKCLLNGADRVIVDTPGWVAGPSAATVYRALIDIIQPDLVLYFARLNDPATLLNLFKGRTPPPLVAIVEHDNAVTRKSTKTRQARRFARFATYFEGAVSHTMPWASIGLVGTHLGKSPALPRHILKFIGDTLRANCVHASLLPDGGVHAVIETVSPAFGRVTAIEEHFKTKPVVLTSTESYDHLLCGLYDTAGEYIAAALIQRIDFGTEAITLLTPLKHAAAIAQVVGGAVRVTPDGRELGEVRPGMI
ncbi:MAG TPA: Clp1/GlmU family protein [Capsulimonadaceae bacterium]|jgi:polynucleotide 5'-kinase involved in rRNA processing